MKKSIKEKSKQELESLLEQSSKDLSRFHFALAGSKQKNVREGRELRKKIARIKTILNKNKHD